MVTKTFVSVIALGLFAITFANSKKEKQTDPPPPSIKKTTNAKIQVAILLDVSGSMDGLIEQAKTQLWNMASVMGRAKCDGVPPAVEIALYEYGRTDNPEAKGYIKQINGFSNDLDKISKDLFSLKTDGGDEYCGQVIYTSLNELTWDPSPESYKVIFIAGNEDFRQGSVSFTKACEEARKKGVIVNTIYCGDKMQGIREHWNLIGECGNGSFTTIDHNAVDPDIPTPYDSVIFALNTQLNNTYVYYGSDGEEKHMEQASVDVMNYNKNKSAAVKRVEVKGKKNVYKNTSWDLVDAYEADSTVISKLDKTTLPAQLRTKDKKQIETYVKAQKTSRDGIQNNISELSKKRSDYIATEKAKNATNTSTLETEIERIVREQAKRFKMQID